MEPQNDVETIDRSDGEEGCYSLDEAIELTGHGHYNHLVLAACSVISNGVALDMFGFSVVVAAASCDLNLGIAETGALASIPFAGVAAAFPWGYYADTRGRRRALLISSSVGSFMAALSSFSPSWQVMLALKFVGCAFSTASFTLTMTYLGECTCPKLRDRYIFVVTAVNLSSEFVSFALAYVLLPLDFKIPLSWLSITFRPWRLFTLVMASVLGIGAVMMLFLQESPKFLADRGHYGKTVEVLTKIFKANGRNGDYPVKHIKITSPNKDDVSFLRSLVDQTVPLFRPPLLGTTILLFYLISIACSTNNIFLMWYATMVNIFFKSVEEGVGSDSFCDRVTSNVTTINEVDLITCDDTISSNTLYSGMFYGLFYTVLTLTVSRIASWRRLVLMVVFTVATISGILINFVTQPVVSILLFILLQGTVLGLGTVSSYFVDMYPTAYRFGLSMSLGMMVARMMSFFGVNVVGSFILNYCRITFYCWSIFIFSGVLAAFFFLPHDRPRSK